jgi:hypothetical protein
MESKIKKKRENEQITHTGSFSSTPHTLAISFICSGKLRNVIDLSFEPAYRIHSINNAKPALLLCFTPDKSIVSERLAANKDWLVFHTRGTL